MLKKMILIFFMAFGLTAAGCGSSGGGGDLPPEETTYTVGGTVIGLSGTLVLQNNGTDDLTISQDGAFTFGTAVADGTSYSVAIKTAPSNQNCSVANGSGIVTSANVTAVAVTCENKTWIHPSSLSDHVSVAGQDANYPRLAVGNNGDIVITWYQSDGTYYQVYKSEYRNGIWMNPSSLDDHISIAGQDAMSPEAAMDNDGNAIIVWYQSDGANYQVYKSEYRNGTWTHPSSLSDHISIAGQAASNPRVAMDNSGNAIITWEQSDGANYQVYKSEYRDGSWIHPSSLSDHVSISGAASAEVSMDDKGNAVIVYIQVDGASEQLYRSEYRKGTWTHPSSFADYFNIAGNPGAHRIAMDSNENAIITWIQFDNNTNYQLYKSEYRDGTWTDPSSLDDHISIAGQHVNVSHVAMDENGSAIITWEQSDGAVNQIYKSERRNGSWINPSSLDDHINFGNAASASYAPAAAMDGNGNAIITWYQYDESDFQIYKSEYRNGTWSNPFSLTDHISIAGQDAKYPKAAMDNNGNAIIIWQQRDDTLTSQIYKSEYR